MSVHPADVAAAVNSTDLFGSDGESDGADAIADAILAGANKQAAAKAEKTAKAKEKKAANKEAAAAKMAEEAQAAKEAAARAAALKELQSQAQKATAALQRDSELANIPARMELYTQLKAAIRAARQAKVESATVKEAIGTFNRVEAIHKPEEVLRNFLSAWVPQLNADQRDIKRVERLLGRIKAPAVRQSILREFTRELVALQRGAHDRVMEAPQLAQLLRPLRERQLEKKKAAEEQRTGASSSKDGVGTPRKNKVVPRDEEAEEEERKRRKLQEKEEVKAGKERKRKAERDAKAEAKDAERVCYYAHAAPALSLSLSLSLSLWCLVSFL